MSDLSGVRAVGRRIADERPMRAATVTGIWKGANEPPELLVAKPAHATHTGALG